MTGCLSDANPAQWWKPRIETPSLGDFQPRLYGNSLAYEMKTIPTQASNWYFKKVSKNMIFKKKNSFSLWPVLFLES